MRGGDVYAGIVWQRYRDSIRGLRYFEAAAISYVRSQIALYTDAFRHFFELEQRPRQGLERPHRHSGAGLPRRHRNQQA